MKKLRVLVLVHPDHVPPDSLEGLTPPSQADVLRTALAERWNAQRLRGELRAHAERRITT